MCADHAGTVAPRVSIHWAGGPTPRMGLASAPSRHGSAPSSWSRCRARYVRIVRDFAALKPQFAAVPVFRKLAALHGAGEGSVRGRFSALVGGPLSEKASIRLFCSSLPLLAISSPPAARSTSVTLTEPTCSSPWGGRLDWNDPVTLDHPLTRNQAVG